MPRPRSRQALRWVAISTSLWVSACRQDVTEADPNSAGSGGGEGGASPTSQGGDDSTITSAGTGRTSGADTDGDGGSESGATTTGVATTTDTGSDETGATTGEVGTACTDHSDCDDLLPCNGTELCVAGECAPGESIVCADDNPCTVDACDEDTATCVFLPSDALCNDGLYCNGIETCDESLGCLAGNLINCDDGIDCTVDACDEDTNACSFAPDHASCSDGVFCNGTEACDSVVGCIAQAAPNCNDFIPCTDDSCDEAAGACAHTPNDAVCDDGLVCNGSETCDAALGCGPGTDVTCADDGTACTREACDEMSLGCATTLDNGLCANGEFCSPGGCIAGDPCIADGDCDDGLACNGAETCDLSGGSPGVCRAGLALACNDGVSCTNDSCSEPGTCVHTPVHSRCSDSDPCDGAEVCTPGVGCEEGPDLSCDDGVACTIDLCITNYGCNNISDHAQCDDGLYCNGEELCILGVGCQDATTPVTCPSDGIACTTEACDETLNGCVAVPQNNLCGCGETCIPADGGCTAACSVATCAGHVYECGDCIDNDMDCSVDSADNNCFGPCDNNESGFAGNIPGQDNAPCKHDCYFDNNSGPGNDDCYWDHRCDSLEPSTPTCTYDPNTNVAGAQATCGELQLTQSMTCDGVCGPLTPNGCDCFGCCEVTLADLTTTTIWLGTENIGGVGTCEYTSMDDPDLCKPCTQVLGCLNACDTCELCFGQTALPPECSGTQVCEADQTPCGLPGQAPCPAGEFCLTGCCVGG